ncbi:hypothetical protein GGR50DRAFT_348577 [Xylaria sp. CBS 124048]|nr:hypothetical protein GGR50DRAFT_348577 [Xylaria sp. CBS 124048]
MEMYTELIKARFLTESLYTSHEKTFRTVTPRNLHRSRVMLHWCYVARLDTLRLMTRMKKRRFALNKDTDHVEESMRVLRGWHPPVRFFNIVENVRLFSPNEDLLCLS